MREQPEMDVDGHHLHTQQQSDVGQAYRAQLTRAIFLPKRGKQDDYQEPHHGGAGPGFA